MVVQKFSLEVENLLGFRIEIMGERKIGISLLLKEIFNLTEVIN
jgi:hypothetical protein